MKRFEFSENTIKRIYTSCIVILSILLAGTFIQWTVNTYQGLSLLDKQNMTINTICLVISEILIVSIAANKPWTKRNRALFRLIFNLGVKEFVDILSLYLDLYTTVYSNAFMMNVNSLVYILDLLMPYCFFAYIREELNLHEEKFEKINKLVIAMVLIGFIIIGANFYYKFFFTIDSHSGFAYGIYHRFYGVLSIAIYILILIIIFKQKSITLKEKLVLSTFQIFPLIIIFMGIFITKNFYRLNLAYILSILLIYINIFAQKNKKMLEQEVLLQKQSTALMISQIQPHFLYNVLTTISNLCVTDPEEAEETTILFSQYLRTNLDSLRQSEPIPFKKELNHIMTYIELEKKRFGDKIQVEYDITADHFLVPALGLQPIIENSIKHGIRGKDSPGHLKITSHKVDKGYEVIIEDDGIGFDPKAPIPDDKKSHVGLINTRKRLEQMTNATMKVESSPGNGCKTTIFFPE